MIADKQTIAAIGFPVIIMALVPIRVWLIPRMPFTDEELECLDGPVASAFVSPRLPSYLTSLTCLDIRVSRWKSVELYQ